LVANGQACHQARQRIILHMGIDALAQGRATPIGAESRRFTASKAAG
jgi:hypothetical protein